MKLDVYDVIYALNDVSDYLVMETAEKSRQLKERIIIKWASLAACICLFCAVAVYSVYMNGGFDPRLPGETPGVSTESDSREKDPDTEQNAPITTGADDSSSDDNTDGADEPAQGTGAGAQGPETTADTPPAAVPVSMTLISAPRKTAYVLGDAPDLAGLSFKVTYSDGTERTVSDGFTCGVNIFGDLGETEVGVSYGGIRGTFKATVSEPEVESISIATYPDRVEYYVYENIDLKGLSINVTYKNGYKRTVSGGLSLQHYERGSAGAITVYVKYGGKTAPFSVTYKEYDVSYIEVNTKPKKLSYYVGEKFDPTGMTLLVKHKNGTTEIISDRFTFEPDVFHSAGSTIVVISFTNVTTELTVDVRFKEQDEILTSGKCGNDLNFELTYNGELTITGTGSMWGATVNAFGDFKELTESPWGEYLNVIRNVKIRDGVTSIGDFAFFECNRLQSIDIPDSVTSIGKGAFCRCLNLESITLPKKLTAIGESTFEDCHALAACTIRDGVRTVGKRAFYGCGDLSKLTLPDSVTSIGDQAFCQCATLKEIGIPDGVTSIGDQAFYQCVALKTIALPRGIRSIGNYTFAECRALTEMTIPDGVTSIGAYAFDLCWNMTEINIPGSVTSIGEYAFAECYNLRKIEIPRGVRSIGDHAFDYCVTLTEVTVPGSVYTVGEYAFYNCIHIERVTIEDGVAEIGASAFSLCFELREVMLPKSVRSIGSAAFSDCKDIYIENPDCEIYDEFGTFGDNNDTTIHGYRGSTAEAYAKKYEYKFIPID